ncbi:MAG: HAD-IB family phosphatase [Thermoplasmata archaeon]|nr:HAD-IB family phosphatase [Thermoplasmata archaeon]
MRYKLILFDMDDTLIAGRTIYEVADKKGFRKEVDEIISMNITNYEKTILIAKLLKGMRVEEFLKIFRAIPLNPYVDEVVEKLKRKGLKMGIISNSYDIAVDDLKKRLGMDFGISNKLVVKEGIITGEVIPHNKNPSQDIDDCRSFSVCKRDALLQVCKDLGIKPDETIAVGDGNVDRFMLEVAGLGIAYGKNSYLSNFADISINDMREILKYID